MKATKKGTYAQLSRVSTHSRWDNSCFLFFLLSCTSCTDAPLRVQKRRKQNKGEKYKKQYARTSAGGRTSLLPAGTLDPALFPDPPFRSRRRCSQTKVGRQPNSGGPRAGFAPCAPTAVGTRGRENAHDRRGTLRPTQRSHRGRLSFDRFPWVAAEGPARLRQRRISHTRGIS